LIIETNGATPVPVPTQNTFRAMNRSFTNVLFGAFGQVKQSKATGEEQVARGCCSVTRRTSSASW
jgi:NAD/NADP transhydrogenase beta subunit